MRGELNAQTVASSDRRLLRRCSETNFAGYLKCTCQASWHYSALLHVLPCVKTDELHFSLRQRPIFGSSGGRGRTFAYSCRMAQLGWRRRRYHIDEKEDVSIAVVMVAGKRCLLCRLPLHLGTWLSVRHPLRLLVFRVARLFRRQFFWCRPCRDFFSGEFCESGIFSSSDG